LWVNLPKKLKMTEPRYQDIPSENIPVYEKDDLQVRVISGNFSDVSAIAETNIEIHYLDVNLGNKSMFEHNLPKSFQSFIYVYEGEAVVGDTVVKRNTLGVLSAGEKIQVSSRVVETSFLLIAGKQLNEPIARGGPFVMNTKEEILKAFEDYKNGILDKPVAEIDNG